MVIEDFLCGNVDKEERIAVELEHSNQDRLVVEMIEEAGCDIMQNHDPGLGFSR